MRLSSAALARLLTAALVLGVVLVGCASSEEPAPAPDAGPNAVPVPDPAADEGPDPDDVISGTATVSYVDLEGGFYGLVTPDGRRLLPDSLAPRFRQDGLGVRFRAVRAESTLTARMWGQPVRVLEMLPLIDDDE
jgi:hypothetical protein